jgi:hypothetical protein
MSAFIPLSTSAGSPSPARRMRPPRAGSGDPRDQRPDDPAGQRRQFHHFGDADAVALSRIWALAAEGRSARRRVVDGSIVSALMTTRWRGRSGADL